MTRVSTDYLTPMEEVITIHDVLEPDDIAAVYYDRTPFRFRWEEEMRALKLPASLARVRDFTIFAMETRAPLALRAEAFGIARATANKWLRIAADQKWIVEYEPAMKAGEGTLYTVRKRRCFWTDDWWNWSDAPDEGEI